MHTVLVVDDHAIVREPLARLIRLEGYTAVCAGNGLQALSVLAAQRVDLILLDLMMPKQDGVVFLQRLREKPEFQTLPVILMTGMVESSLITRARALGVAEVLYKSRFSMDELSAMIRAVLNAHMIRPRNSA